MQNQLTCIPQGLCSWNYRITGTQDESGVVELYGFGETGMFEADETRLFIAELSGQKGKWTVSNGTGEVLSAARIPDFKWDTEIVSPDGKFTLERIGMTRGMKLSGPGVSCEISPAHAFTRRVKITGRWDDLRIVVFAMWLVNMTWKRDAQN